MSLRRSARVKALPTVPIIRPEIIPKRKASTGIPKSTTKAIKSKGNSDGVQKDETTLIAPSKKQPPRKRQKLEDTCPKDSPMTPTPAAISLMTEKTPVTIQRPSEPHTTNAPIISPGTSDTIVANPPSPTGTTTTILTQAIAHLTTVDTTGTLAPVIAAHPCPVFSPTGLSKPTNPFRALCSSIISQQVSGAAASSIQNKFISLFAANPTHHYLGPPHFPPPSLVAEMAVPTLRTAGLSQRKAEYISGLAERFVDGRLSAEGLLGATDSEVMEMLVQVRGLGRWSVEMFSCFELKRMDVFSTGDLGVQRGMAAYTGKDVTKLKSKGGGKWKYMSEKDMLDISEKFSPYRSLFMWYMWTYADTNVTALKG